MRKISKIATVLLSAGLSVSLLGACSNGGNSGAFTGDDGRKTIVVSDMAEYDWTINVLGDEIDNFNIVWLTSKGVDMHSYQPSMQDMAAISSADAVFYTGGESEEWIDEALLNNTNSGVKVISMMKDLSGDIKEEEIIEGMNAEEEEEEEEKEYDEHIFLSLDCAMKTVNLIAEDLSEIDPTNADKYNKNAEDYCLELAEIKDDYKALQGKDSKNILVADRFPFRYLFDDFEIDYYAAFPGCSAETESSFETIVFLSEKITEDDLSVVYILEHSEDKLAKTIIENSGKTDVEILKLNSMQSVTEEDFNNEGKTYINIMKENLESLSRGFGN